LREVYALFAHTTTVVVVQYDNQSID